MCFSSQYFNLKKEARLAFSKPNIAKEDIIVYKILHKDYRSLHRRFQYEKNTHYYQTGKNFTVSYSGSWTGTYRFQIHTGLHSYKSRYCAEINHYGGIIVKFVVPKGAKYYENSEEIVSNQLILN